MQNLLAFLTRYNHWLLFLLLEVASVVLLFRYNSYQGSLWVSSANIVTGKVYAWQAEVDQFFRLQERARQLTQRNIELEHELHEARQALLDLGSDSAAIDSMLQATLASLRLTDARVVSNSLRRRDNLMTIDRGTADGIREDMGVVCGTGLVGVVYMAGSHYAVVMPVLNVHSRISCAIRDRGYFGYLKWDGRDPTEAYMDDVPRHAQFTPGEWIETSGFSAIFPPGITVGRIISIGNSADGLSYRLRIKLSTDFGCLRNVSVITDESVAERMELLQAARDSMAIAN